jgi:signal transduction histidine kinase
LQQPGAALDATIPAGRGPDDDALLRALEPLRAAAAAVAAELDSRQLLQALARQLASALGAARAWVAVADEEAVHGTAGWEQGALRVAEPDAAVRRLLLWMAQSRRSLLANDPTQSLPGGGSPAAQGWRNVLGFPFLNHQGRALGAFLAIDRRGGSFTRLDVESARIQALQATIGLERALLLERLDDWTRGLEALLAFSAAVNRHLDPPALVRHLVEHAARFLKASGGLAGLARDGAPGLFVAEAYWHAGAWRPLHRTFRPGEGLPGLVVESDFPYLANDYPAERLADAGLAAAFAVGRALCVPIRHTETAPFGFFELHRGAGQPPFTWQDATFLESLANTTAVAMENAALLREVEAKSRQVRALSAHNVTRLEEERRHIARELHDEAGQALVGVKLALQVMARLVPAEPRSLRDQLDQLRDHVNQATAQIKDLARRLRPPALDQLGLDVALRQLTAEYEHRTELAVELDLTDFPARLPQPLETTLYRVAQEALTNVAAHAGARRVRVALVDRGEEIELSVADDGRGFDVQAARAGLGLLGIRERVDMLGGRVDLASAPGAGTTLRVTVPCPGDPPCP